MKKTKKQSSATENDIFDRDLKKKRLALLESELNDPSVQKGAERYRHVQKEKKVLEYLLKELPDPGERIREPMNPNCNISVVIPCCGDRKYVLRSLGSLANQAGIEPGIFEVIAVVYDPVSEPPTIKNEEKKTGACSGKPGYHDQAVKENREILGLIAYLNGGKKEANPALDEKEKGIIEKIKQSEMNIHVLDRTSSGNGMNVGEARNRGTAETVARFYETGNRNGLIVQLNADAEFNEDYIRGILRAFEQKPGLAGIIGRELPGYHEDKGYYFNVITELINYYDEISRFIVSKNNIPKSIFYDDFGYFGSNVISRAFETAAAGGIPRLRRYELLAFEEKLSAVGITDREPRITTKTFRYSLHKEVSIDSSFDIMRYLDEFREKGTFRVRGFEYYKTVQHIHSAVNKLITGGDLTPQNLDEIFNGDGWSLLSDSQVHMLCEKLEQAVYLEKEIFVDWDLRLLFDSVCLKIDKRIPRVNIEDAVAKVKSLLPAVKGQMMDFKDIRMQIETEIMVWTKTFGRLLDFYYENKPRDINTGILLNMLRSNKRKLEIDDGFILFLEVRDFDLDRICDVLAVAKSKEEAVKLLKKGFFGKLSSIDIHESVGRQLLEMRAIKQVVFNMLLDIISESKKVEEAVMDEQKITVVQGKIDLQDATFIIPVRFDSQDRLDNINIIIDYIKKHFDTHIMILEAGPERHLFLKDDEIIYTFIEDLSSCFYKTKYLNDMIKATKTPLIVDYDCDALLDEYQLAKGIMLVRKRILDMCYPFDGNFLELKEKETMKNRLSVSGIDPGSLHCLNPRSYGGVVIYDTGVYREGGMENEYIRGWGPEDYERCIRFRKLGYKVARIPGPMFHLAHRRGTSSGYRNPYYYEGQREFEIVLSMKKKQLAEYVKTWSWIK